MHSLPMIYSTPYVFSLSNGGFKSSLDKMFFLFKKCEPYVCVYTYIYVFIHTHKHTTA